MCTSVRVFPSSLLLRMVALRHTTLILTWALASSLPSFNVSNVIGSFAVIQRGKPSPVWGWASAAGTAIQATWVDGKTYSGVSDATLFWRISFPASQAVASPFNLTFTSSAGDAITLSNLLIGDVFLCSGQSNMGAVTVAAMANATDMVQQALQFDKLRIFQVSGNVQSDEPLSEWPTSGLVPWQPPLGTGPTPSNGTLLGFSAVCWIMGSTLYAEYLDSSVPIGLLHSSHGGTSIQAWQSPASANSCGTPSGSWNSSVLCEYFARSLKDMSPLISTCSSSQITVTSSP